MGRAAAWIATVALVSGIAVGACSSDDDGDGDDSAASTTAPLTLEEWGDRVEAICAEAEDEVTDAGTPADADQVPAWLEVQIGILENQADKVEALGLPDEHAEEAAEFVTTYRDAVAVAQEMLDFSSEGAEPLAEDRAQQLAEDRAAIQDRAPELREALGVEGCTGLTPDPATAG